MSEMKIFEKCYSVSPDVTYENKKCFEAEFNQETPLKKQMHIYFYLESNFVFRQSIL